MTATKKGAGLPAPNYTQTPNAIFDLLPSMSNAELRATLVIVRETFGWHRQRTGQLSIPEIAERAGMSESSTKTGLKEGQQRGTLKKFKTRDEKNRVTYRYGLVITERVNFDHIDRPRKEVVESDPAQVEGDQSSQNLTGSEFDWINEVPSQNLTGYPPENPENPSSQNLTGSYKEERNPLEDVKEKREGTAFPAHNTTPAKSVETPEKDGTPPDGGAADAANEDLPSRSANIDDSPSASDEPDHDKENVPGGAAAREPDPAVEAYIRKKLSTKFVDNLLDEIQPLGVDRRRDWFGLPLDRVEAIFAEAVKTHRQHDVKVPTRVKDLLDQEVQRAGLPPVPATGNKFDRDAWSD